LLHSLKRLLPARNILIAGACVMALFVIAPAALSQPGVVFQVVTSDVSIAAGDPSATEAGLTTGTFTISRTGDTTDAVTVNYSVTGTAANGTDYAMLATSAIIPAAQSSVNVVVTPIDDATPEDDETVILTVTSGTGYTVGAPSAATVTITDNDLPAVTVVASDAAASEAGPNTGTFTVSRTGPTTDALSVGYNLTGTAGNGTDYSALASTVLIPVGQASATVTVTPINDGAPESAETVILTIATNALYTVGSPSAATVTITDNDLPTVNIEATDDSAAEASSATGTFTITRSGNLTAALTVNYTISGSAGNGSDYAALSGSVVVAAGSASATVVITPVDDAIDEVNETVILTLAAGTGYQIGSSNDDTVTIADNDGAGTPPVGARPTSKDQCKRGGWQTFGVFKNQGDCVSWVATGGSNPPAG
jgi:hypothetical protein